MPLRIAPCSMSGSPRSISLSCPGVSRKVINLPWFSQRMWIFVLNPPRLRPKASASALLFLPRQHAGELAPLSSQCNGSPNQRCSLDQAGSASEQRYAPTFPTCSNAESGCTRSSTFHIFQASLAMALQCARPITCRSRFSGDPPQVVPFWASAAGAAVLDAPIVHSSSRLGFPWRPVYSTISDFAYRP